jgi:hypothetical protein
LTKGTAGEWANVFYISGSFYVLGAMIYLIFGTSERQKWSHHPTQMITAAAADIDDGKEDARQLFQSPVPSSRPEIS